MNRSIVDLREPLVPKPRQKRSGSQTSLPEIEQLKRSVILRGESFSLFKKFRLVPRIRKNKIQRPTFSLDLGKVVSGYCSFEASQHLRIRDNRTRIISSISAHRLVFGVVEGKGSRGKQIAQCLMEAIPETLLKYSRRSITRKDKTQILRQLEEKVEEEGCQLYGSGASFSVMIVYAEGLQSWSAGSASLVKLQQGGLQSITKRGNPLGFCNLHESAQLERIRECSIGKYYILGNKYFWDNSKNVQKTLKKEGSPELLAEQLVRESIGKKSLWKDTAVLVVRIL